MTGARSRGAEGFTLIEMLVALTLLGLITLVSFGGLRFGARAWEAGSQRAAEVTEIEAVQSFLRRQMSRMLLLPSMMFQDNTAAALRGDAAKFQFLAAIPPELGLGGIAQFRLSTDFSEGPGRLILDWSIYRPDGLVPPPDEAERRRSLIGGIASLTFRYFGPLSDGEDPVWSDRWDDPNRLPDLVALDIRFTSGDPRRWPDFAVAPKLAKAGFNS